MDVIKKIRLDKYLADMGVGTRKGVKQYIRKGEITVNGVCSQAPECKVDPDTDEVCVRGQTIAYEAFAYFMFHKPAGCVSAVKDRDKTVLDFFKAEAAKGLFPVGRLDKDTEGLLLITNDGVLAHELLSPRKQVPKVYYAKIEGVVTKEDVIKFKEGLEIGEKKPILPAKLMVLKEGAVSEVLVELQEGKYHQVKRMFQAVGKQVQYLKRISMGTLTLDDTLQPGAYRPLTATELETLKKGVQR